jgi:hypothetical protein
VTIAWLMGGPAIAATAHVTGTLGILIGADLLNLRRARALDAPILSISGAGTFDGIFVTAHRRHARRGSVRKDRAATRQPTIGRPRSDRTETP